VAWLLHLILPPDPANPATDSAARSHATPGAAFVRAPARRNGGNP